MIIDRSQITSSGFIFVLCTWITVEATEFLSLISGPDGDFCITNSSVAMYYTKTDNSIEKRGNSYLPRTFSCDFENLGSDCAKAFTAGSWEAAYNYMHVDTPILDARWELLYHDSLLPNEEPRIYPFLRLSTLYSLRDEKNFRIILSIRAEEAHILLCDDPNLGKANCYWFVLQGWGQQYTAIKKCTSGQITEVYPKGECEKRIVEKEHPKDFPLYMNNGSWSNIVIERNDRNLYLKVYKEGKEEVIIHYFEKNKMFPLISLLGFGKDHKVYCKLHENRYMRTNITSSQVFERWFYSTDNAFCLSLFVNTCHSCLLEIIFVEEWHKEIFRQTIPPTNGTWKHFKVFTKETGRYHYMKVAMRTFLIDGYQKIGREFWSFDYIRECYVEDYRTTQIEKTKISECRLLNGQKVKQENAIEYVPATSCSTTPSIGRPCISCSVFRKRPSCEKLKICEIVDGSNKCFCSPGYTGETCNDECPQGTYGYSCRSKCGFCIAEGNCDRTDGSCLCNYLFEEPTCHMPKVDQILRNAPKVIGRNADSCKIQWNSNDYVGKTAPKYYLIQYAESKYGYRIWKDYKTVEKIPKIGNAMIRNLNSEDEYRIRILISDQPERVKNLNLMELPYSICRTACNGWNDDEVNIDTTSEGVNLKLTSTKKKCDVILFKYELINKTGGRILSGEMTSSRLSIKGLTYFTNYTIVLHSEYQTIRKEFTTQDGVPSPVRNLQTVEYTTSSITLRWEEPQHANGIIERYNIKCLRLRRVNCSQNTQQKNLERNTTKTTIELNNLEPYTVYQVEIYAINRRQSSKVLRKEIQTQGLDYFTDDEHLERIVITTETFVRAASIQFQNVKCSDLKGLLTISIKLRCISEWCTIGNGYWQKIESFRRSLEIQNLQPYCEYKCEISFFRFHNKGRIWKNVTFSTKPSVPSSLKDWSVIATGKNFISLRWLPPYPPTGMISGYRITTRCISCELPTYKTTRNVAPKKCSIWPEYYCLRITDNVIYGDKYSIEIEAYNQESLLYTVVAYLQSVEVRESPPEKPRNLVAIWNLDNTMELFWNHPNKTNGDLKRFDIEIIHTRYLIRIPVYEERFTYYYKFSTPFSFAVDINIRLFTVNNLYSSEPAEIKESSYPAKPDPTSTQISIKNYTETTITISLNITQYGINHTEVGQYAFVLIDDHSPNIKDPNLANLEKLINSTFDVSAKLRIVAEINLKKRAKNVVNFTIGNGDVMKQNKLLEVYTVNKPLQKARYYKITIIMINKFKGKYQHTSSTITALTDGESSGGIIFYVLLILSILIVAIIFAMIIKCRSVESCRSIVHVGCLTRSSSSQPIENNYEIIPLDWKETCATGHVGSGMKTKAESQKMGMSSTLSNAELYSKPIRKVDFEEYVKVSLGQNVLVRQYEALPSGLIKPCEKGQLECNQHKNRFNNIIPYDYNRVVLQTDENQIEQDYINASHIRGLKDEIFYIAAQGPKATTIHDFWLMVWQENIRHIVMLVNLEESGLKKVEQYWPNYNEDFLFGNIQVHHHFSNRYVDYELRVFRLVCDGAERKVYQYHFLNWPDNEVPMPIQSLAPFMRKTLEIFSKSPILVHCCSGSSATGVFILCHMCLQMARYDETVDIIRIAQELRKQRVDMVHNMRQYKFVHLLILEILLGLPFEISCEDEIDNIIAKLTCFEELQAQLTYLQHSAWRDRALLNTPEYEQPLLMNPNKNKVPGLIPDETVRVELKKYPANDENSWYINAIKVDGYRNDQRYIVSQQPMPNTVKDFWRMVDQYEIQLIISLNDINLDDEKSCPFWPSANDSAMSPVDYITLTHYSTVQHDDYDIITVQVLVHREQEKSMKVKIAALKGWKSAVPLPEFSESFLKFCGFVNSSSRGLENVLVTCYDGCVASGLFLATNYLIEMIKLEKSFNVIRAVRAIRVNRKEFLTHEEQLAFLYVLSAAYVQGSSDYANFGSSGVRVSNIYDYIES